MVLSALTALLLTTAPAPPVVLPNTEVRTITSRHVPGVEYRLYVGLPADYAASKEKYPVVYLLDADYYFALAHNIVEHLTARNNLPKLVLVAIAYGGPPAYRVNRMRDYSPTHALEGGYGPEVNRHSGGGPAFKKFLAEELIPFVEKTYRVTPERTLVGHSMGGLFAIWTAFTTPDLFARYLSVSPSFWWDERTFFGMERAYAAKHRKLPAKIYVTAGDREDPVMARELLEVDGIVRGRRYEGLAWSAVVEQGENHNTIFPIALTRGLRFHYGIGSNAPLPVNASRAPRDTPASAE